MNLQGEWKSKNNMDNEGSLNGIKLGPSHGYFSKFSLNSFHVLIIQFLEGKLHNCSFWH